MSLQNFRDEPQAYNIQDHTKTKRSEASLTEEHRLSSAHRNST